MRRTKIFIAIIFSIYAAVSLIDYAHFPYSDGAEHGAAVRELAKNLIHPFDPMLAHHPGNSPRFVPSIMIMALTMRLFHLHVVATLKIFLIVYFMLFVFSAALFTREYFASREKISWAIASLLFLWGIGWTGANAYMFTAILYTAYFPSLVSFSLTLLSLYFQLFFLRLEKKRFLVISMVLGGLTFVNHPLTGVFFFICSGLLYIERKNLEKKIILYYLLSIVTALTLMALWPYYTFFPNLLKIASGQMGKAMDYKITHNYLYTTPLLRSAPALAAIPILVICLFLRRYLFLVAGFFIFSLIYLAGYFFDINLAERFVFFIIFTLQMAFSCWSDITTHPRFHSIPIVKRCKIIPFLLLGIGIIIQSALLFNNFIKPAFILEPGTLLPRYRNPNAMYEGLAAYLGEHDVILSDIYTSWSLPVYTGAKIIALFHTPPQITDNGERIKDIDIFYNPATPNSKRISIIRKYRVTHILLNFTIAGKDIESSMQQMGLKTIASGKSFCLFSVPSFER